MLDKIKLALRISHSYLDEVIQADIDTARAEMVRAGINEYIVNDDDNNLIFNCIKTFVLATETDDTKLSDGYFESFKYQLNNLRKSGVISNV